MKKIQIEIKGLNWTIFFLFIITVLDFTILDSENVGISFMFWVCYGIYRGIRYIIKDLAEE